MSINQTFLLGSKVVFSWIGGASQVHNVNYLNKLVNDPKEQNAKNVYDTCNFDNQNILPNYIKDKETPNREFQLDTVSQPGTYEYFVCGIGNGAHCFSGVKAQVRVVEDSRDCDIHHYPDTRQEPPSSDCASFDWTFNPSQPQPKLCVLKGTNVTFNTNRFHNVNNLNQLSGITDPKTVYENCDTTAPGISTTGAQKSKIVIDTLDTGKINYFFCGVENHCKDGNMKAEVFVYDSNTPCPPPSSGLKKC